MSKWFQASISYHKEDNKGKVSRVTEVYLVDAVSHTDAEARIHRELTNTTPNFHLSRLVPVKLQEVFILPDGGDTWYKVKVSFISFDEKAQKEKLIPFTMLINAENPLKAHDEVKARLGSVEDYQITNINITNILEVFPYIPE